MKYVINVAKRTTHLRRPQYLHHFRAEVMDYKPACRILKELSAFYPAPEYEVTATLWKKIGEDCTEELLKEDN